MLDYNKPLIDCWNHGKNSLRLLALCLSLILLAHGCGSARETTREYIIGYQVQLVQTSDRAEAESARAQAVLDFNREVYLLFEAPFFKVRVGNFLEIDQADALQKLAVKKGFENAWLVRGKIDLDKLP